MNRDEEARRWSEEERRGGEKKREGDEWGGGEDGRRPGERVKREQARRWRVEFFCGMSVNRGPVGRLGKKTNWRGGEIFINR